MSNVRRIGNFGIADLGQHGMATFSIGSVSSAFGRGSDSFNFSRPNDWGANKMRVGNFDIVPMGYNNAMPNELRDMLDEFYAGEGILEKIQGLQWGEGPRLYKEVYTEEGEIYRHWLYDSEVMTFLKSINFEEKLLRCHTDLTHGFGYFYKVYRNRAGRIGLPDKIVNFDHISVDKCRFEYPAENEDYPKRIVIGSFPNPDTQKMAAYPIFDKNNPFTSQVSMGYQNIYSFCKQFYSTPRFYGAYSWIKLASGIAPLLIDYNKNATVLSFHIESPQSYWEAAETHLKEKAQNDNVPYTAKMLEDYKTNTFEEFTQSLSGAENVGKFLHTVGDVSSISNNYVGWKVTPIDKQVKQYIEAQIAIANKADATATTAFGLHPSLANIMVEGKMASGSEMLYALKSYIISETAIPEMILFAPLNAIIAANYPGKNIKLGFYRNIVKKESEVTPSDRVVNTA